MERSKELDFKLTDFASLLGGQRYFDIGLGWAVF